MNLSLRQSQKQNRLAVAKGEGGRRGMAWEPGISRCELVHTEWISKVPLYSTGNYSRHPVTSQNGKEREKYMCV